MIRKFLYGAKIVILITTTNDKSSISENKVNKY